MGSQLYFTLITFFCCQTVHIAAREQSITVVGQLICDRKYFEAEVELWERDLIDPDDFLNRTERADGGYFVLVGTENEFFSIEVYVKIKHKCDVQDQKCYRLTEFEVPTWKTETGIYDMSFVSLNLRSQNDREFCSNT
ncbi:hypothetical protein M3Y96_00600600 [Aphelenchoides besseyi]|nr:hypothetical protein M3Y96_00600600 [Aphelenchoides besseyi]